MSQIIKKQEYRETGLSEEQRAVVFFTLFGCFIVFSISAAIIAGSASAATELEAYVMEFQRYFCINSLCG